MPIFTLAGVSPHKITELNINRWGLKCRKQNDPIHSKRFVHEAAPKPQTETLERRRKDTKARIEQRQEEIKKSLYIIVLKQL